MPELDLDVSVIGGSGVDTIVSVPQLDMPVADSHMVPMVQTRVGHTGDNVALGCHALGLRTRPIRVDRPSPLGWRVFLNIAALPEYGRSMRQILRRRARVVVATAGADGCYLMTEDGPLRHFPADRSSVRRSIRTAPATHSSMGFSTAGSEDSHWDGRCGLARLLGPMPAPSRPPKRARSLWKQTARCFT